MNWSIVPMLLGLMYVSLRGPHEHEEESARHHHVHGLPPSYPPNFARGVF